MAPAPQDCWRCCWPLLLTGILLTWWGWRYASARCGRPRPPLSWGGYLLASALAVYPVACVLMLIGMAIQDIKSQRAEDRWNQRSYLTLDEAKPFGETTLPKGSWVNRQEPRLPGTEDSPITMDGVTAVRFPQPQSVAGVPIIAFEVLPPVMELASAHTFTRPSGQRGALRSRLAGHLLVAAGSAGSAVGGVAGRAACGGVSAQRLDVQGMLLR